MSNNTIFIIGLFVGVFMTTFSLGWILMSFNASEENKWDKFKRG